jgi:hypothetical protein
MKMYFGFALASSMFQGNCTITRRKLSIDDVRNLLSTHQILSCLNKSHEASIQAMTEKFGLEVSLPDTPPKVSLEVGDSIIVMSIQGLPRLTDRAHYTHDEVSQAKFEFVLYTVV